MQFWQWLADSVASRRSSLLLVLGTVLVFLISGYLCTTLKFAQGQAGGCLRTSTRRTLNVHLLLLATV